MTIIEFLFQSLLFKKLTINLNLKIKKYNKKKKKKEKVELYLLLFVFNIFFIILEIKNLVFHVLLKNIFTKKIMVVII